MKLDDIRTMLLLGENPCVEFKAVVRADVLGRVICGLLNTSGGYVVCGVGEDGKVVGVDNESIAVETLERKIHEGLSPKAMFSMETHLLDGKQVLVIEVPVGMDQPYAFRDSIFTRSDTATKKADVETIRNMVLQKQIEPERWERRFSFADIETDLDHGEIHSAVLDAQNVGRAFFRDPQDPIKTLEDLAVARYGRLTQGGDVLFANNPAIRLPQVRVRANCYHSDKSDDAYRDMKSLEGPLCKVFEDVYSFIVRNTPTLSHFRKGSPKREDVPLYPESAVREALINAFAHRDYTSPSGGIAIHIYPRRLEIWNSGFFPDGVTPESLASGQISILKNPDIAHVLYLRGLMEKTGRGSIQIIKACREANLPAPKWVSDRQLGVTFTLYATEATTEATTEVKKLLMHLEGVMSRRELQETMHLKNDEHFRKAYLLPALEAGMVEMSFPDKPSSPVQKYRLTGKGKILRRA